MQATAPSRNSAEPAGDPRAAPSAAAVNQPLYRIDGPINSAVPSQQASRLWLAAVATALPLIVYGLIVAILGGALLYSGLVSPLFATSGYGIGSLLMTIAGAALIGLAVRPFLLTPIDTHVYAAVSADAEIDLQTLVTDVAAALNVEPPESILLSVEPVIRAVPRRQGTMPNYAQLRLVIGIPAMMALSQRELGGAIAHELGHFAVPEHRALRKAVATCIVTLAQAANGTDRLDRVLHRDESVSPRIKQVVNSAINAGRWPLKPLLRLTRRIARETLNEIEFHGDWFQAELVGPEALARTAEHLHLLQHAQNEWLSSLTESPTSRYPSDLARVLFDNANRSYPHRDKLLRDVMLEEQTLDKGAHPANHNRIDRVTTMCMTHGTMHGDSSAAVLLLQPAATAQQATLSFLRHALDIEVSDDQLMSEAAISQLLAEERELGAVLDQYLLGFHARRRYLPPGDPGAVLKTAVDKRIGQLDSLCEEIRRASPEARNSLATYQQALDAVIAAAETLAVEQISSGDDADTEALSQARRQLKAVDRELSDAELRYADRLALGIATALSDAVRENPAAAQTEQKRYARLVGVQSAFAKAQGDINQVREALAVARVVSATEKASADQRAGAIDALAAVIGRLRALFAKLPDPLADADQSFLAGINAAAEQASDGSALSVAHEFLVAMDRAYLRVMVRLAETALATETRHGVRLKLVG